ncbi:hypothetical protein J1N10_13665 [Carboxylicivirga sp. A043]|uniref:hypothetical protein n=1 Tax=Carboxylicivirga litoralis TaxID=2816963 RepID=UPI0021CB1E49|nr:hypothetical protein [Carboxylicivirga sp. A043]MCU4157032.1 hypothetical protein [Carboxylicivirga sp. A043]
MNLKLLAWFLLLFAVISSGTAQEKSYFTPRNIKTGNDSIHQDVTQRLSTTLEVFKAFKISEVKKTVTFFVTEKERLTQLEEYKDKKTKVITSALSSTLSNRVRFLTVLWIVLAPFYLIYIIVKFKKVFIDGI